MPLTEGQVQLRGLVMGAGSCYQFVAHFNPFVRNNRADQSGPRAWQDGSWSGAERSEQVVIPMRMVTLGVGAAGWLALQQPLAAAFAPADDDVELRFVVGGSEFVMYGRPRMVQPDTRMIDGTAYVNAAFVALDPRVYSGTEHVQTLMLPTASGGLTVPITTPVTVGATVTAGRVNLTNVGTASTGLVLRIDGPATNPRVSLLVGSVTSTLRIAVTLTSGQWLDVDTAARTVYLNGTASRRGQAVGDWPILPAGTSEFAFDSAVYNAAAQVTIRWRDSWY